MLSRTLQRASLLLNTSRHCQRCATYNARELSSSAVLSSGHSRWSTIKHDKGKNDAARNKQWSIFSSEIATASKLSGPDPNTNARLASIISSAKRVGFPKASIEAAIARGQGISSSKTELESVTIEALLPPSVAVVIDCQTDNKSRTLQDVRLIIKEHDGTVTPTSYLFTKAGKLVFQSKEGINAEMALEAILDFGVIDAFEEEGRIVILTEPNETSRVLEVLESQFELQIGSSDIIWTPNQDTMVTCAEETAFQNYTHFLDEIQGVSDVQAVHTNAMWKIT